MIWEVLEVLLIFAEVIMCYLFVGMVAVGKNGMLALSWSKKWILVLGILFISSIYCLNRHLIWFAYNLCLLMLLVYGIVAKQVYQCGVLQSLSLANFYYVILVLLDYLFVFSLYGITYDNHIFEAIVLHTGKSRVCIKLVSRCIYFVTFILLGVIKKFDVFKVLYDIRIGMLPFLGYPVIFLFMCLVEEQMGSLRLPNWGILLGFMLVFACIFCIAVLKITSNEKLNVIHMRSQMIEQNYNMMLSLYEAHAKEYHDFKNHINVLYTLAEEKRNREILRYLEAIQKPLFIKESQIRTGNKTLDIILNYKVEEAKRHHISLELDIRPVTQINIEPKDLCVIWGNCLDNAIEACEELEEKARWIHLGIQQNYNFLFFYIENSMKRKPQINDGRFVSTKQNKRNHGWGILGVDAVVNKYQGVLDRKYDDQRFEIKIYFGVDAKNQKEDILR